MQYQGEGESITPAELDVDSRLIPAVKAHRVAAAHLPLTSTPPASTPSQTTPPPNTTPHSYYSSSSRYPPSTSNGGLQNRLQTEMGH
ncbi:hypothetical protein MTO96_051641 [Rhipicephalus appendiculatus]